MMNRMGNAAIVLGLLAAMAATCPAIAQDEDPWERCHALFENAQNTDNADSTEFTRLVKEERFQDAMDLSFKRAKAWQVASCQIFQRYTEYPSVSLSFVWEASTQEVNIWLCFTRTAMLMQRGKVGLALSETKVASNTCELAMTMLKQAENYHDQGM